MKKWTLLFVVGLLLFVVGLFVGKCSRKADVVELATIDTLLVREFITDTSYIRDTIVTHLYDTLFIDSTTPLGDIPVRHVFTKDSIPIRYQGKTAYVPYYLTIYYRGLFYRYEVQTHPQPFALVETKKPWVDFYGTMSAIYTTDKTIKGDLECGVMFWDRFALLTRIEVDNEKRANFGAGIKVRIF